MREWISTFVAIVVIALTGGDLALGIIAWFAAWAVQAKHPDTRTPERRYRMRETERRNRERRRRLQGWLLTKM